MLPEIDEATARAGAWATGILATFATLWKVILRGRRDLRLDHAEGVESDGRDRIIKQLTEHVDRLDDAIKEMGERLQQETLARIRAQGEAEALRRHIAELKVEIDHLKLGRAFG